MRGTVAMLSGDGGIGKSLLMQQLATCACLRLPWLGLDTAPGYALMLACEDDEDELWRRQVDINRALGIEQDDAADGGLELWPRVGQDNALARLDRKEWKIAPTQLYHQLVERCRDQGHQYVIIDTATQTFLGNQNDETQVVQFITLLRRLAMMIQGCVILTKHPSLSGRALGTGESGNTAWNNSVRSRLYVYERKDKSVVIKGMKSNYGKKVEEFVISWRRGAFVRELPPQPKSYGYADC